jgi:hypothetical protein
VAAVEFLRTTEGVKVAEEMRVQAASTVTTGDDRQDDDCER